MAEYRYVQSADGLEWNVVDEHDAVYATVTSEGEAAGVVRRLVNEEHERQHGASPALPQEEEHGKDG